MCFCSVEVASAFGLLEDAMLSPVCIRAILVPFHMSTVEKFVHINFALEPDTNAQVLRTGMNRLLPCSFNQYGKFLLD